MSVLCNTHIGLSRGKPRIFLEGEKLRKGGFEVGDLYSRTVKDKKLVLKDIIVFLFPLVLGAACNTCPGKVIICPSSTS